MSKDVTIALTHRDIGPRKLTKIVLLRDGFAVVMPYHIAEKGLLIRYNSDLSGLTTRHLRISDFQQYTANTKAKLSFHLGGLVHFSGKGIRSGIDRETGLVKGLGLKGDCPIEITTEGPAFSISIWGLHDFKEIKSKRPCDLMYDGDGLYFRGSPDSRNSYVLDCFLMNKDRPVGRFIGNPVEIKWKGMVPFLSVIGFEHTLRVIDLPGLPCFLGCMVSHVETHNTSESGFALMGPSFTGPDDAIHIGISAFYPPPFKVDGTISLDYPSPNY